VRDRLTRVRELTPLSHHRSDYLDRDQAWDRFVELRGVVCIILND
jgi:hypothetical protein